MTPDQMTKKPPTKTELLITLAERTELTKQKIDEVLRILAEEIARSLAESGSFTLPGLLKIDKKQVPARAGGTRPNPFKPGEMMEVAAKPASTKVTVKALKQLKDFGK